MLKAFRAFLPVGIAISGFAGTVADAAPSPCRAVIGIPGNAPFTGLKDGEIDGVIATTAAAALRAMGCEVTGRHLPFARLYKWVHAGRLDVATSVLKTSERASLAHYSIPILTEYTVVMYALGRKDPPRRLTDLAGLRVGAQLGFRYPTLDGYGIRLQRERSYQITLKKLSDNLFDAILIGSITGPFLAKRMGYGKTFNYMPFAIGKAPLGVALSKTAFNHKDLERFNREVKRLTRGSLWRKTLEKHGIGDLVRTWPMIGDTSLSGPGQ